MSARTTEGSWWYVDIDVVPSDILAAVGLAVGVQA